MYLYVSIFICMYICIYIYIQTSLIYRQLQFPDLLIFFQKTRQLVSLGQVFPGPPGSKLGASEVGMGLYNFHGGQDGWACRIVFF